MALLAACGGPSPPPRANAPNAARSDVTRQPKPVRDAESAQVAAATDKLAVAAGCVTRTPDPTEVVVWRKEQQTAVSRNLQSASSCFSNQKQPAHLQIGLEFQSPTSSKVWISGSTLDDCTLTRCVAEKLSSTALPPPPPALGSTDSQVAHVILSFDSRQSPALRLGATPDAPFRDGPCIDHSRLPKSGRLPATHIQSRVRDRAPEQRKCYEQGLARDPALAGRLALRFTIALDGSVRTVEVKSNSLPDCQVVGCVSDVFRTLRFDPPQGGSVSVEYPVVFAPLD